MKRLNKKDILPIALMLIGMGIIIWFNWQLLVGFLSIVVGAYMWELNHPRSPKE